MARLARSSGSQEQEVNIAKQIATRSNLNFLMSKSRKYRYKFMKKWQEP
jgi:hypothetical protein